ncbi:hydroxymethylpyrimidine/phosphomethylpyrimidine kinase [Jiella sp. MQZ9-1]|uniref:hydroxymethylpyrimidine kinase n=1 Tax=Jiella flava TaxID=2816857 RepID=A0A939G070_9HYPH|nr:hydroxymethylpyrimidine/phosphomethylpyrimidine kinase [Jiella flava]MBO0664074.1 hydroxymethylpyrimidine/phosphomethylpyrimidine kinase [Jiella flava]MCD2472645.1 hydroxymethylpyrimidine/phosphomethylpyrimidine kinase [Jiella flava]
MANTDPNPESARAGRPVILAIGGTDSSGGAGLAADIRTARDHGIAARLTVTAVTAQSDRAVGQVLTMPPALVGEQVALALEDGQVAAVKIGMLSDAAVIAAVAEALRGYTGPIVLDPVIAASSGGLLLSEAGLDALIAVLVPRVTLVTPNLPELAILAARLGVMQPDAAGTADDHTQHATGVSALLTTGVRAVLVKGGHAGGAEAVDTLYRSGEPNPFSLPAPRLNASLRGTGCALASAIACRLADGDALEDACRIAKTYVGGLLAAAASPASR